jgi:hypothetical protein
MGGGGSIDRMAGAGTITDGVTTVSVGCGSIPAAAAAMTKPNTSGPPASADRKYLAILIALIYASLNRRWGAFRQRSSQRLGSLHIVSRPSTWLSRPKASQEPMLMLSSTISSWL